MRSDFAQRFFFFFFFFFFFCFFLFFCVFLCFFFGFFLGCFFICVFVFDFFVLKLILNGEGSTIELFSSLVFLSISFFLFSVFVCFCFF